MTRPLAVLLLTGTVLATLAGPAAAALPSDGAVQVQRDHVLCVGGSNDPASFEGVCVWAPLPV